MQSPSHPKSAVMEYARMASRFSESKARAQISRMPASGNMVRKIGMQSFQKHFWSSLYRSQENHCSQTPARQPATPPPYS